MSKVLLRHVVAAGTCTVLLLAANLAQHPLHPPVAWCEQAAAQRFRTTAWREHFQPWRPDPIYGKSWTPAHEARLQDFSGKWVYISCITIFLHLVYFGASLVVELIRASGRQPPPQLTAAVYGCCAPIGSLAMVVMLLYCVMWTIATYVIREWRAQWDFFEARGFPLYPQLMALVHLPSLLCVVVDIVGKDPALLRAHTPSTQTVLVGMTTFHVCYEAWLFLNYCMCGAAIPYPWYYDLGFSPYPVTSLAAYGVGVNVFLSVVVVALRRFILWRAADDGAVRKRA